MECMLKLSGPVQGSLLYKTSLLVKRILAIKQYVSTVNQTVVMLVLCKGQFYPASSK